MQSEGGAAGALHGALQAGALGTAMEVERDYSELVQTVKQNVRIPVAVKFSHFFSAI